jgi:Predicted O-methyltransferase
MKVGTDGVLLGAWATITPSAGKLSVLDVGTGTGLIAMIIAQRHENADIDAIDIDEDAFIQAVENVEKSPFNGRINVFHKPFFEYLPQKKYDLIISNPPFFKNALKCPDGKRSMARHNDSLPLRELIEHATTMLSENGRIALILPTQQSEELDFIIATHRLYTIRRTDVISVEGLQPKRFMIEMSAKNLITEDNAASTLVLETKEHERTQQYQELTKEFYL